VFAYNPAQVKAGALPTSIMDLAKPQWKGKVGISAAGADFQAIVSAVLSLKGETATAAWLKGLKDNTKVYQDNGPVMKAVNTGDVQSGVIYHYYWYKDQAESGTNSKNVKLMFFGNHDPGAFLSISGAGVDQVQQAPGRGPAAGQVPQQPGRPEGPLRQQGPGVPDRQRCCGQQGAQAPD